jgi:hypothetical protein
MYKSNNILRRDQKVIIIIMALQPFVGPWSLIQFLNPIHSRYESLGGGSARGKASICTQNKRTQASMP